MKLWNRTVWFFVLAFLVAGGAIGCGGGDDDDDDDAGIDDDDADDDDEDDDIDDDVDDDTDDDVDDDVDDDIDDDIDDDTDDDVDDDTDDDIDDDIHDVVLYDIDFEDYAAGPLGAPFSVAASGTSTMNVADLVAAEGTGKVLNQAGGDNADATSYIIAQYDFTETSEDVWVSFDVSIADSGVDWGFRTVIEYYGYTYPQTQLVVENGSLKALDFDTSNYVTCGSLTAADWDNVAVLYDYSAGSYNVNLNGSATACANVTAIIDQYPAFGLQVMDWSDDGFGGQVDFDQFLGEKTNGDDIFAVDFESGYSVGPLGSPWTIYDQDGDSTASIIDLVAADGSGKAVRIDGGTETIEADYIIASYQFTPTSTDWEASFDVFVPTAGAEFGFRTIHTTFTGDGPASQLVYQGGSLTAYDATPGQYVTCAPLSPATWYAVKIVHHYTQKTFDVLVDDAATACSGLQKQSPLFNGPYKFFQVIDWSDADFGGDVTWDNFYGYIP